MHRLSGDNYLPSRPNYTHPTCLGSGQAGEGAGRLPADQHPRNQHPAQVGMDLNYLLPIDSFLAGRLHTWQPTTGLT